MEQVSFIALIYNHYFKIYQKILKKNALNMITHQYVELYAYMY